LRQTRQRQVILDLVLRSTDHPTAAQLFERARRVLPGIGYATVYRTLGMLAAEGIIQEVRVGDATQYDGRTDRHDHLVCRRCGRVHDVVIPVEDSVLAEVARQSRFRVDRHHTELAGICPDCQ
jgi:Fe2+ or Zn2+ uptake regulation protein